MTISFFGHRDFVDNKEVYAKILQELLELVKKEEKLICYCGGYGGFDRFCEKILLDLKRQYNKIVLCYVSPYLNEKFLKSDDKIKKVCYNIHVLSNSIKKYIGEKI